MAQRNPWRRFVILLLAVASLAGTALPSHAAPVAWKDWNSGLKAASTAGKPVLVDVFTDWCTWCKRMDQDVYAKDDVRAYLATHFVTVKLNAEYTTAARYEGKAYTSQSLAQRFRVNSYPTTIFLRADGTHIANVPGYVPAERFVLLLRYIGDGYMDRGVGFDDFVKQQEQ
jgi:thioredoxin-related protein